MHTWGRCLLRSQIAIVPVPPSFALGCAGLLQGFASHTATGLNTVSGEVPLLLAVRAKLRRFVPAYSSECGWVGPRLCCMSPVDGVFLLEVAKNRVGPEGRGVHGGIKRRLEMFMVVPKGIEKKYDLDLIKIDGSHIGDPRVHREDLIGTITEGSVAAIVEIESFLEQKELSVGTKFLVALLERIEHEMRSGKWGDHIVVSLRDAPADEAAKGAVVGLPDIMCLRMKEGVQLRQRSF